MIMSGWFNVGITVVLFATLVSIVLYYYRPKKREELELDEQPKYRMLNDDDE
jgi:cbb3-type cytochrome oxidase subunit 3